MKKTLLPALILAMHAGALMAADAVIEPPMVLVPAGAFDMGDAATKAPPPNYPAPIPVHRVTVPAFQMAKYEVTVNQFRQFVEATGHQAKTECWKHAANEWGMEVAKGSWSANAYPQGDYLPAMCVTWNDAKAYTAWLTASTGKPYRLPSESEWEYAARAGSLDPNHFGKDLAPACRYGNIRDKTGHAAILKLTGKTSQMIPPCDDGQAFTSVPGTFEANAFGLFDMVGNLNELVEDCQHMDYTGAPTDGSAWTTNCAAGMIINKGASYAGRDSSSYRGHAGPDTASSFLGFRVALGSAAPVRTTAATARAIAKAAP